MQDEMEEKRWELEERRETIGDEFEENRERAIEELEGQTEQLREEKMLPLEEQANALEAEMEERWVALDALYAQQGELTGQLKELQATVRDLDRQAEFGVLNVISGALENAEELEKQGGIGSFDAFLPDMPGSDGGPPGGGGGQ